MIHYTLNTGHSRISPRSEVSDAVIKAMAPYLEDGDYRIEQITGWYFVKTTSIDDGAVFTVIRKDTPLVTCGLAVSEKAATEVWESLQSFCHQITDLPIHAKLDWESARMPEETPWLSTVIVAPQSLEQAVNWLGDFERCMAWAWMENRGFAS